jgi:hypothetical protein
MPIGALRPGRHGWDLFAIPVGNVNAFRGTCLDAPEMRRGGFVHPVLKERVQGIPRLDRLPIRHLPAYVLRAPVSAVRPDLSPDLNNTLLDLANGLGLRAAAAARGITETAVRSYREAVEYALGIRPRRSAQGLRWWGYERQAVARAFILGNLRYETDVPAVALQGNLVRSLAMLAVGGPAPPYSNARERLYDRVGATNSYNVIERALAMGTLVVGPPYAPEEYPQLANAPQILSSVKWNEG